MKLIDLLDLTTCDLVKIVQGGKELFIGKVEDTPYKHMRREIIAFGFVLDELEELEIVLQIAV